MAKVFRSLNRVNTRDCSVGLLAAFILVSLMYVTMPRTNTMRVSMGKFIPSLYQPDVVPLARCSSLADWFWFAASSQLLPVLKVNASMTSGDSIRQEGSSISFKLIFAHWLMSEDSKTKFDAWLFLSEWSNWRMTHSCSSQCEGSRDWEEFTCRSRRDSGKRKPQWIRYSICLSKLTISSKSVPKGAKQSFLERWVLSAFSFLCSWRNWSTNIIALFV